MVELLPADAVLPDSVLTLLDGIDSRRKEKTDLLRRLEGNSNNVGITPLSSNLLDSALDAATQGNRDPVTESQMVAIITEQERTGLSEDDIRASWPDINPGSEGPGGPGASEQVPGLPAGGLVEETAKRSGFRGG